ncbi:hypothetical protein [Prosthecobacter sp.]|uniref:hypothetical protein n=1 Tax=Prosthecobacter sp. TaxID=1965333 RepID=UPI003782DC3A
MLARICPPSALMKDEKVALECVFSIFGITREVLLKHGAGGMKFAKLVIPLLNQIVRPFTAKWHRCFMDGAFQEAAKRQEFRQELGQMMPKLRLYTRALAEMAGVEDLTAKEML